MILLTPKVHPIVPLGHLLGLRGRNGFRAGFYGLNIHHDFQKLFMKIGKHISFPGAKIMTQKCFSYTAGRNLLIQKKSIKFKKKFS